MPHRSASYLPPLPISSPTRPGGRAYAGYTDVGDELGRVLRVTSRSTAPRLADTDPRPQSRAGRGEGRHGEWTMDFGVELLIQALETGCG
jgi:hypothetical protein